MGHPYHHAVSSARRFGGVPEDYQALHDWFDQSKSMLADTRHRALRHHAEGIFMLETLFGTTLTNQAGKVVPVRLIGEQHVQEDLGFIPSMQDWFKHLQLQPWMRRGSKPLPDGTMRTTCVPAASIRTQGPDMSPDSRPT